MFTKKKILKYLIMTNFIHFCSIEIPKWCHFRDGSAHKFRCEIMYWELKSILIRMILNVLRLKENI